MRNRIELIYEKKDRLSREIFRFVLLDMKMLLDNYSMQSRKTARHKYVIDENYDRLMSRGCTLLLSEVPLTQHTIEEAKKEFCNLIEYQK